MRKHHFNIIELLVVIGIIGILAGLLLPVLGRVKASGRRTTCLSNLKQISVAVTNYSDSVFRGRRFPSWLSNTYESYAGATEIFVCPDDPRDEVRSCNRSKTLDNYNELKSTFDDPSTAVASGYIRANDDVPHVSYCYEFCGGIWPASWASDEFTSGGRTASATVTPGCSWQSVKISLLKDASRKKIGLTSRLPLVRCIWHADGRNGDKMAPMLNVSTSGNVYTSMSDWTKGVDL